MKKQVREPKFYIFLIVLSFISLFGFLKSDNHNSLQIFGCLCIVFLLIISFLGIKKLHITKPLQNTECDSKQKSKAVANAEKDTVHMQRMLKIYTDQLSCLRNRAKRGIVFSIAGDVTFFLLWGSGKISFNSFCMYAIIVIIYGLVSGLKLFIYSDNPNARRLARAFNILTPRDNIEYIKRVLKQI